MSYENVINEALGLAYTDNEKAFINLGEMRPIDNPEAIEAGVIFHNEQTAATEYNPQTADAESINKLMAKLIPTFDEYLHFYKVYKPSLKQIEKVEELTWWAGAVENAQQDLEHFENMQRLYDSDYKAKTEDYTGDAQKRIKEGLKRSQRIVQKAEDLIIEEIKLRDYHPEKLKFFAGRLSIDAHTPDHDGYVKYLQNYYPDFYDDLAHDSMPINLKEEDRQRHTYIVGGSGSGKSELIKLIASEYKNMDDYAATVVIDPHGDLSTELARLNQKQDKLVYLAPNIEAGHSWRINPLQPPEGSTPEEREVIAQQLVGAFEELLKGGAGSSLTVNMRALLLPCLIVLLDAGDKTLVHLQDFLRDETEGQFIALGKNSARPAIARFFRQDFGDGLFNVTKQSLRTKLQSLFNTEQFYNVINGTTTIDLDGLINERKTILFNLSKGDMGEDVSEALGRFVIALIQGMAMRRQKIDTEDRTPVHLFIDECQNYIGKSTVTLLEEARKYGVHLTLAQQVAGRGMSSEVQLVTLNNTAIKLVGRTPSDPKTAKLLGVEDEDIQELKTAEFFCKASHKPAFKFKAHPHLVKKLAVENKYMTDEDFETVKQKQIKKYYARIGAPIPKSKTSELV